MTTAANWFPNVEEFRMICRDAVSEARSENAQKFANEMTIASTEHGLATPMTTNQVRWLCTIADWIVPLFRKV